MNESQLKRLREIAELLAKAQELYHQAEPAPPAGILLGADLTSAAARTHQLLNQLAFEERRAAKRSVRIPGLRQQPSAAGG